jgi:CRP/FNR family transcriptional regulator, anaerobic regulatory protein
MNEALESLFRRHGNPVDAPPGASLFSESQPCRHVVLLASGSIRVYRVRAGDREATLYRVRPGELCLASCLAALCDAPLLARAVAEEPLRGWAVPAESFRQLFLREEPLRDAFLDLVLRRVRTLLELIEEIQDHSVDDRLAAYLLDRARVGPGTAGEGRLAMTHEKIAADLWTAREVVSRALKGLEHRGCVRIERGSVVVLDAERLADASSQPDG